MSSQLIELNGHKVSLSQSNIILRGCQVKNTKWVIGVVVYAGQETKAMLNSAISPSKRSRLEQAMNSETIWLFVFLFILCLVVAIGMCLWLMSHQDAIDTIPYYRKSYLIKGKFPGKPYKYYGIPMETFFCVFEFCYCVSDHDSDIFIHHHGIGSIRSILFHDRRQTHV